MPRGDDAEDSRMPCSIRLSPAAAWRRAEDSWSSARVAATRLGTNLLALIVPHPLATSNPRPAVNPVTFGAESLPLTTSAIPDLAPAGPRIP